MCVGDDENTSAYTNNVGRRLKIVRRLDIRFQEIFCMLANYYIVVTVSSRRHIFEKMYKEISYEVHKTKNAAS